MNIVDKKRKYTAQGADIPVQELCHLYMHMRTREGCSYYTLLLEPDRPVNVVSLLLSCGSYNSCRQEQNRGMNVDSRKRSLCLLSLNSPQKSLWVFGHNYTASFSLGDEIT